MIGKSILAFGILGALTAGAIQFNSVDDSATQVIAEAECSKKSGELQEIKVYPFRTLREHPVVATCSNVQTGVRFDLYTSPVYKR